MSSLFSEKTGCMCACPILLKLRPNFNEAIEIFRNKGELVVAAFHSALPPTRRCSEEREPRRDSRLEWLSQVIRIDTKMGESNRPVTRCCSTSNRCRWARLSHVPQVARVRHPPIHPRRESQSHRYRCRQTGYLAQTLNRDDEARL